MRVVRGDPTGRHDMHAAGAITALGAAAACFITGESLPVGLLPQLSASLHTSLSATGLLVTLYAAVVFVVSAPLTHLTRDVPRRVLLSGVLAMFVIGTLASAAAPGYGWLLGARIVTAAAQAVFWSVAPVTAAGLLTPQARGRAVAGVFGGSAVGIVLGVPAATWLGQQAGWRVSFVALAGFGLLAAAAIAALLATSRPSDSHAATGTAPDRRRYRAVLVTTVLMVSAFYTSFTYISAFLTRVSGLGQHVVPIVLIASGAASTVGLATSGLLYARRPAVAIAAPLTLISVALLGLYSLGTTAAPAFAFQALDSLALGGFIVAAQTAVLVCAPGSSDIATAWFSALFNAGIAAGPLIGGLALGIWGLRSTALAGAVLGGVALTAAVSLRAT